MKFICLGYFDEETFDKMPLDEVGAFIEECRAFGRDAGDQIVDFELLQSPLYAKTVSSVDGKVEAKKGSATNSKEVLIPVITLDVDDMDQAVALLSNHPGLKKGGAFEIRRVEDLAEILGQG